jgi:hypothetical protein
MVRSEEVRRWTGVARVGQWTAEGATEPVGPRTAGLGTLPLWATPPQFLLSWQRSLAQSLPQTSAPQPTRHRSQRHSTEISVDSLSLLHSITHCPARKPSPLLPCTVARSFSEATSSLSLSLPNSASSLPPSLPS